MRRHKSSREFGAAVRRHLVEIQSGYATLHTGAGGGGSCVTLDHRWMCPALYMKQAKMRLMMLALWEAVSPLVDGGDVR